MPLRKWSFSGFFRDTLLLAYARLTLQDYASW